MHNLSLQISWLLKECQWNMLSDENRITGATKTISGSFRWYIAVKITVALILNRFLSHAYTALICSGLCVEFRKPGKTNHLNGLFTENGLDGILKASGCDAVDTVFPFLGAIFDACCGSNETADITWVCPKYVDMVNHVYRHYFSLGLSEEELGTLFQKRLFKVLECHVLEDNQSPKKKTQKWHALDLVCDAVRDMIDISYFRAGISESAHKSFKNAYCHSSEEKRVIWEKPSIKKIDRWVSVLIFEKSKRTFDWTIHRDS